MSTTLRIALAIVILLYFIIVISLLKRKKLALKYTLLWLAMGVMMALLTAFPIILEFIRRLLGFESAMNALYVCALGFCFILILAVTSIVSNQSERIKDLIQHSALLEKRIRELEEKLGENNNDSEN